MNRRNKIGGIIDRRFGENDPSMAPEERMMERFVREQSRRKGTSAFDLEEADDDDEPILTHGGRALDTLPKDDFEGESVGMSSDDENSSRERRRISMEEYVGEEAEAEGTPQPERPKTHKEIMQEVIAKSKLHKYERQKAKEDDDEQREELDGLAGEILGLLGRKKAEPKAPSPPPPAHQGTLNPERAALINGEVDKDFNKEYDAHLRQMAMDQRAQPTERTKTDEEKAVEDAERLKKLEEQRLRRMRGEPDSDEEDGDDDRKAAVAGGEDADEEEEEVMDDAEAFGFKRKQITQRPQGVDDEDEFLIDQDLVASGSDIESGFSDDDDDDASIATDSEAEGDGEDDDDDEFLREIRDNEPNSQADSGKPIVVSIAGSALAFTYPCPQSHAELLDILKSVDINDVPTVVQRIRALYDPRLAAENKAKLAEFACALVDHVHYLAEQTPPPPPAVLETLIRHLHSMSLRQFKSEIATTIRKHLRKMQSQDFATVGDITILTAVGSIYPTSDHFHQVVTPAITIITRWLGLCTSPSSLSELIHGAYLCLLCLSYQKLAKRYVPELVRFSVAALNSQSPNLTPDVVSSYIQILSGAMDLWSDKSAFTAIFTPAVLSSLEKHPKAHPQTLRKLRILLSQAKLKTRYLELHHHRPLPIKTQIPKFEENYNPDKHYDPNRERTDAKKLQKEYKKERKGALRELRKDANFIAREKLKQKKETDRAYEEKYRKLVASIQNEEGAAANEYEREKRARKNRK